MVSADAPSLPLRTSETSPSREEFAQAYARARAFAADAYGDRTAPTGERVIDHALAIADILVGLRTDGNTQLAALLYGTTDSERAERPTDESTITELFGDDVGTMVRGIVQLMHVTELARSRSEGRAAEVAKTERNAEKAVKQQAEALRKMLLAMVGDLRVVLVRLASRLRTLRWYAEAKEGADAELRLSHAQETLDLYAPLANRLGIWQLKWELEDLAFRFIDPQTYKRIARMLEEKRAEREGFIQSATDRLRHELAEEGVIGEVSGRPKHIYSIWNKMRGKGVDFAGLYDVRAFRIIVEDIKDCYTVLGIVHHLWQPIPREFDDYISRPKGNGYQSLHTVVVADDGRPFEIQIRTREMHQFAEYGVAAHWRYKEAGNKSLAADNPYDEKIAWIRQLFAWKNEVAEAANESKLDREFDADEWTEKLKSAALDDRIYVLTPQARVVDLPVGATPLDFAYHLHTDLGHRCRGAKVDGAMVPLNTALRTGQTIEIVASKAVSAGPSRDWLNPQLNYLVSPRARSKVRAYFNGAQQDEAVAHGRARIERELQRLGKTAANLDDLAGRMGFSKSDEMFIAAARDDFNSRQVDAAFSAPSPALNDEGLHAARIGRGRADSNRSGVLVVGMDKLLTQLARCCKPAPPDPICGFTTKGRGVSIHRSDCTAFQRLARAQPERVIDTQWGKGDTDTVYPVDVVVLAQDRQGLLRDVSDVFAREKINVIGVKTQSTRGEAHMQFTAEVRNGAALQGALLAIRDVRGIIDVRRR